MSKNSLTDKDNMGDSQSSLEEKFRDRDLLKIFSGFPWTIVIIVMIWGVSFYHVWYWGADNTGVAGDTFGAVNALFSGLAFAFIIITLSIQQRELKVQLNEFRENMKINKQQSFTLSMQRFDNTFFQLLDRLNVNKQYCKYIPFGYAQTEQYTSRGHSSFESGRTDRNIFNGVITDIYQYDESVFDNKLTHGSVTEDEVETIATRYLQFLENKFFSPNQPYFSVLFELMEWVRLYLPEGSGEEARYYSIIRAQLSIDERYLVYCYCATFSGLEIGKLMSENNFFGALTSAMFPRYFVHQVMNKRIRN